MTSLINKARKPKFELHLHIYDLNNVPLVSGTSQIKWHLPRSIHGQHRGRTPKTPIDSVNHRVVYGYAAVVPLRIAIDRANRLAEQPIEFEVVQEFPIVSGGRDEKITLGTVTLNLSEYVEESDNFPRHRADSSAAPAAVPGAAAKTTTAAGPASLEHAKDKGVGREPKHGRMGSKSSAASSGSTTGPSLSTSSSGAAASLRDERGDVVRQENDDGVVEEGIIRRYLMQESKINSTLKIGILMVQVDGERTYVAPPLKTAPMFGGIAGIMAGEQQQQVEQEERYGGGGGGPSRGAGSGGGGSLQNLAKSQDSSELQDMYRRALAASWSCMPDELPADQCIEAIFAGRNGWRRAARHGPPGGSRSRRRRRNGSVLPSDGDSTSSGSGSGDDATAGGGGRTLRPADIRRMQHHLRQQSSLSDRSTLTVTGLSGHHAGGPGHRRRASYGRPPSKDGNLSQSGHDSGDGLRSRTGSMTSLTTTTLGSEREREGYRKPREVCEAEARDDLVAWQIGTAV